MPWSRANKVIPAHDNEPEKLIGFSELQVARAYKISLHRSLPLAGDEKWRRAVRFVTVGEPGDAPGDLPAHATWNSSQNVVR